MTRPVVSRIPDTLPRPETKAVPAPKTWQFSFRFWRQLEYFGVGGVSASWFVSLLERLRSLSGMTIDSVTSNPTIKQAFRYHPINWNARNVPLQRNQFDWLPNDYLSNSEEYPFFQFHVSKALGRVIGFWNEIDNFEILLLDPLHNLQPSNHNGYKVRDTQIGIDEFSVVIKEIEQRICVCASDKCQCREIYADFQSILTASLPFDAMILVLPPDLAKRAAACIEISAADSLADLVELGLDSAGA